MIPRVGMVFGEDCLAQAYIELPDELVAVGCIEDGDWATVRLYNLDDIENHRILASWGITEVVKHMLLSEPALHIG